MISAPVSPDEPQRLQCLRSLQLLDSLPDPALDAITAAVADALACPIALISLVDEHRQWFKSRVGLEATETPRELAFCAHAIVGDGPLVVSNAHDDRRFSDNPLVTGEPGIGFYAGHPLRVDGHAIGTLCVIDREPRELAPGQALFLDRMARAAQGMLVRDSLLRRLSLEQARLHDFAALSSDFLWECDDRLRLTWVGDAVAQVLRRAPAGLEGQLLWDGPLLDATAEEPAMTLHRSMQAGSAISACVIDARGHGGPAALSFTAMPVFDPRGRQIGWRGACSDVSAQRELGRNRVAVVAAEARTRDQNLFLSRASHELRTPLNAVIGFTGLLLDEHRFRDADKRQQWLGHVHRSGQYLLQLVDDLLDLTRQRLAPRALDLRPVGVKALVRDCMTILWPQADEARVALEGPDDTDAELWVRADARSLRQAVSNLLSNGIKYSRAGGRVFIQLKGADGEGLIRVCDNGPGIHPEGMARIFEPFERLGAEFSAVPGTGLGLTITKSHVESMGGSINVECPPGGGTCFVLRLPACAPPMGPGDWPIDPTSSLRAR